MLDLDTCEEIKFILPFSKNRWFKLLIGTTITQRVEVSTYDRVRKASVWGLGGWGSDYRQTETEDSKQSISTSTLDKPNDFLVFCRLQGE